MKWNCISSDKTLIGCITTDDAITTERALAEAQKEWPETASVEVNTQDQHRGHDR